MKSAPTLKNDSVPTHHLRTGWPFSKRLSFRDFLPCLLPLGSLVFIPSPAQANSEEIKNFRLSFKGDRAIRIHFEADPTLTHQVEYSTDMQVWHRLALPANPINSTTLELFHPEGIGETKIFYRVPGELTGSTPPVAESIFQRLGNLGDGTGSSTHSFSMSYPDAVLVPLNDPAYGQGATEANRMSEQQVESAIAEGIRSWRKPGAHGSCVSCHSPDGFDLAIIGYSDADITRRALDHVSAEDAAKIVQLVKATRQRYGIERPLHPLNFRPLQPGHEVLPGATHEARDLAFGNYLNELGLLWAEGRIESREQALAAQAELLAIDLRKLRVGIPFDRWSEDGHHGSAHVSVSEWVPNMGVRPVEERAEEWYALHDAYIADPSDENFWAYYNKIPELLRPIEPAGFGLAQQWNLLKYESVQIGQHMLRHQSLTYPDPLVDREGGVVANRLGVIARNPLFRTGDHVRRFPLEYDAANPSTTFPPFLAGTIPTTQAALKNENINFQRVWFWMGWAYDPALLLSDNIFQTIEGDYLYASLLQHYKIHHAFVVAMTSVAKANVTGYFEAPGPGVAGHGKWAAFNPFMVLHHIERNRNEPPANTPRRVLHDRMYSNTARMWIYLVHDDLERTGTVFDRELVRGCVRFCRAWLNDTDGGVNLSAIDTVVADIEVRLNSAQELRTDFSGPDLPGGLPFN